MNDLKTPILKETLKHMERLKVTFSLPSKADVGFKFSVTFGTRFA
ncbi:hypothetical protein NST83_02725 [Paenibacillus sp. FSL R10-2782]